MIFFSDVVEGDVAPDGGIEEEGDSAFFEPLDASLDDMFFEFERGDPVGE